MRRKQVHFNDKEECLVEYVDNTGMQFSTYVKYLIRKEMKNLSAIPCEAKKEEAVTVTVPSEIGSKAKEAYKSLLSSMDNF